jgi:hypothetical protein
MFEEEDGGKNGHLISSSLRKAFNSSFFTGHQSVGISLVHIFCHTHSNDEMARHKWWKNSFYILNFLVYFTPTKRRKTKAQKLQETSKNFQNLENLETNRKAVSILEIWIERPMRFSSRLIHAFSRHVVIASVHIIPSTARIEGQ